MEHGLSNSPGPGVNDLDAGNPRYSYGNSGFDIRDRYALTANYQLPFDKSSQRLVRVIGGGWQLNSLAFWQSGQPFSVSNSNAQVNLPNVSSDRPNQLGNPKLPNPTLSRWFNTADFAPQTKGTDGNEEVNQLHGPPDRRIDLSIFRTFPIRDRLTLQLRAEGYNILNMPNFGTPAANLNSPGTFGIITSTAGNETPRQMQFAAKVQF